MNVLLTGATGLIGKPLMAALLKRGWAVDALVRSPHSAEAQEVAAMGARLVPGDVTSAESVRAAVNGKQIVINNAGWYALGIGGRQAEATMQAINVDGARIVMKEALAAGAQRVVHVSSIVAWGDSGSAIQDESYVRQSPPPTVYERTKLEAHELAVGMQTAGAPVIIAAPASAHGAGDHASVGSLLRLYVRGLFPALGMYGDGGRSLVYVDDCAEGIALCAEKGRLGESYMISAGPASYREVFDWMAERPGGVRPLFYIPDLMAGIFCRAAEPVERLLGLPIVFSADMARSATTRYYYSGAKSERELGLKYRPPRQVILDTVDGERRRMGKV